MPTPARPILPNVPHLLHGGDYNPDQWLHDPAVLDEDFRLMPLAGCNTFSVGIFAWTALEPQDGVYTFEWLDQLLDRLAAAGHKAILATPSGAKPAWLAAAHPEVCRVTRDGRREPWWHRHNHCFTSPVYRAKVQAINDQLARRYARHPALGLWHISNEYNGECHCPLCYAAFRRWLQARYGTLEALNQAWWTRFWSHTFTAWDQIHPLDYALDGAVLDWKRFVTDQTVDFLQHEVAAVRAHTPDVPVTTNMMGAFEPLDYWKFGPHLSVIANDSYPLLHDRDNDLATFGQVAFTHDLMRSLRGGQPFLLMESTPSVTNWQAVAKLKRPGIHRLEMLHALAHGADGTMYFQWRKGRGGCEKLHGAVVDHVGHEHTRVFREVADVGRMLHQLTPIRGSLVQSDVALVYDWDARWALAATLGPSRASHGTKDYQPTVDAHYQALWKQNVAVDLVSRHASFDRYKVLVLPMAYIADGDLATRLARFVEAGGTVVATYFTGQVDSSNRCHTGGWPGGGLRQLFGVWVEEVDNLYPDDPQAVVWSPGNGLGLAGRHDAREFCELVHAESADVLATYGAQFYAGRPAVTCRTHGAGRAYYVASRNADAFHDAFLAAVLRQAGVRPVLDVAAPPGVSIQRRLGDGQAFYFVLNFTREPQVVPLGELELTDVASGEPVGDELRLPGYGGVCLRA